MSVNTFIVIGLVAAIVVGIIFLIVVLIEKSKKKQETEEIKAIDPEKKYPKDFNIMNTTAQELIPFDDIDSSMICLPNGEYRMVIEVGSVNYYLKTSSEQENIEAMFRNAIGSWDFPFMFYVQTREVDNTAILRNLKKDIEVNASQFPNLVSYGKEYLESMKQLGNMEGRNLTKRNYIIISCNDSTKIKSNKTEADRRDYAFNKLSVSFSKVKSSLSAMNIQVHCLNSNEIADMLFCAINKSEGEKSKGIGSYISYVVKGSNDPIKIPEDQKLGLMFESFENRIRQEIMGDSTTSAENYYKAERILDEFDSIKKEIIENDSDNNTLFNL